MAYPSIYKVSYSYTGFQQAQQGVSAFPGTQLDADLAGLYDSVSSLALFVEGAIRSDGALSNGLVTYDSLSADLQTNGIAPADAWVGGHQYFVNDAVITLGNLYRCLVKHTSGVFATDLAAGKWKFVSALLTGLLVPTTLEAFGGGPGVADNKAAFDAAVASTGPNAVRITLGVGLYNFLTVPAVIAKNNVIIEGAGEDITVLQWSAGNMLEVNGGFAELQGFQLRDLTLYNPDIVTAKNAIKLVDQSHTTIERVKIIGGLGSNSLLSGSGGAVGIYSQGRDFLIPKNVTVYADRPVRLGMNPNHYIAADHYHFEDMFLVGGTVYPLITLDPGVILSNVTLNGISGNLGTDGFYFNDTAAVNAVTAVNNGGVGHHAGDVITLAGGAFTTAIQIRVLAVSSGVITAASVVNPGVYTILPTYPAAQGATTGSGTGATFTLTLGSSSILKITDCRFEQGTNAASSSIFISPAAGIDTVKISEAGLGGDRKGVYLRKTKHATLELVKYTPLTATMAVDADTSNECLVLENCDWLAGSTDNITLPYVSKSTTPTGESAGTHLAPFAIFSNTMGGWSFQDISATGIFLGTASNYTQIRSAAAAGASAITLPAGITDFSATGGVGQVVKQSAVGAPFTVGYPSHTSITNSLGGIVALNNTANFFDGPSIAQGTVGTWWVSGTVTLYDTAGGALFLCQLWDGTTIIDSSGISTFAANNLGSVTLSGFITAPAGNLRISCKDATATTGKISATDAGVKSSTISAFRIA